MVMGSKPAGVRCVPQRGQREPRQAGEGSRGASAVLSRAGRDAPALAMTRNPGNDAVGPIELARLAQRVLNCSEALGGRPVTDAVERRQGRRSREVDELEVRTVDRLDLDQSRKP